MESNDQETMALMKFNVEKFNGNNDFGLWRIKMKPQYDLDSALKPEVIDSSSSTRVK